MSSLVVRPVGWVRSPFREKVEAPRQPIVARDVTGTLEVLPAYEDALCDLDGFDRIWLLFWFHRATGEGGSWKPKVLPPRSDEKRGVFATRSPHRPNPIGMSAVRLERREGRVLHLRELDLVDGTPVLDIKPYLAYADAFPDASAGWLEARDPRTSWQVEVAPRAEEQMAWVEREASLDLRTRTVAALTLGPRPHAYRRIKENENGERILAVKDWRVVFRIAPPETDRRLVVEQIRTGYRPRDLTTGTAPAHVLHRAFVALFEG